MSDEVKDSLKIVRYQSSKSYATFDEWKSHLAVKTGDRHSDIRLVASFPLSINAFFFISDCGIRNCVLNAV